MDDPTKDYLTKYRSFIELLLKSDFNYPLPVKVPNYNLTEQEVSGGITTWCLQYLIERECPNSLATILCKRVLEEISRIEPELCGYRPQEQVYSPLQLIQETIKKLAEVCTLYTDNAQLSELPPPPSSILHDPIISMCGVKNCRRTMEDRHIAVQDLHTLFNVKNATGPASYYAVFDGHNGSDAATYANCHLHHYLVQSKHYPHNPEAALREAFTITDKRFIEKTAKGNLESGTTAVCALIRPAENMLYLAWVGDSQAVLVTKGMAYQLVKPHRPDQPEETKRIHRLGGSVVFLGTWRVDGNLAVSRAIGDKGYKRYIVSDPDIKAIPLTGRENYLILASDGLWDYLTEQMVVQAIDTYLAENKGAAAGVSNHLIQFAKDQCSRDNISCIVIFLRDPSELSDVQDTKVMDIQELEQNTSTVVEQLWMKHHHHQLHGNNTDEEDEEVKIGSGGGDDDGSIDNKQNGRTMVDEEDLGPETDVDSVDDVLLSPSISAAKALVSQAQANNTTSVWPHQQERLQKEQQMWLKTLPWSYADAVRRNVSLNKKQEDFNNKITDEEIIEKIISNIEDTATPVLVLEKENDNILDIHNIEEVQIKDEPKEMVDEDPTVIAKGEEVKNYVADNEVDSGEDSEEEWNYIPGKENIKDNLNKIQHIQQELNATEDEEDMESRLNPNAAEFVPVFIPPNSADLLDQVVSSSPAKGAEQSLENIDVPTVNEFYSEISTRPSELDSLVVDNDMNKSLNETTINGIADVSTKAVYGGDDDTLSFIASVNSSTVTNVTEEDEEMALPLKDNNPFLISNVPKDTSPSDTIQEQMVQDHFSLSFKPIDPMSQSVVLEDEGHNEDETSENLDAISSEKPDLTPDDEVKLSVDAVEINEAQTSSSGFDSESGPDDGDVIPNESGRVDLSFGEDGDLEEGIANTKSMSLIDDSHPIEKIEQTISPSARSPLPEPSSLVDTKPEPLEIQKSDLEVDILSQFTISKEVPTSDLTDFLGQTSSLPELIHHEEETEKLIVTNEEPSPQVFDLVQELQFNQEPTLLPTSQKEEEPESDSGFEIINASEASNEVDLINNETLNSEEKNIEVESSLLVNGFVSSCVPDLLLKPTESDLDRQPSPVGTATEDFVADIERAILNSSPLIEQNLPVSIDAPIKKSFFNEMDSIVMKEDDQQSEKLSTVIEDKQPVVAPVDVEMLAAVEDKQPCEVVPEFVEDVVTVIEDKPSEVPPVVEQVPDIIEVKPFEEIIPVIEKTMIEQRLEETKNPFSFSEDEEIKMDTFSVVKEEVTKEPLLLEVEQLTPQDSSANSKEDKNIESPIKEEICEEAITLLREPEKAEEKAFIPDPDIEYGMDVLKEEIREDLIIESPQPVEVKEEISTVQQVLVPEVEKVVEDIITQLGSSPVPNEEEKAKDDVVILPAQPTPPTTPAPGVQEEDNKQELIAAALAAAGVAVGAGAAVAAATSPKVAEKPAIISQKTAASKKPEFKAPTTKLTPSATKTTSKPSTPTSVAAATKKPTSAVGPTARTATKPASSASKPSTPTSKPSTPTAKTAPVSTASRPSSATKPRTPTTKTPASTAQDKTLTKPRTPTTTKAPISATTTTSITRAPGAVKASTTATKPSSASTTAKKITESLATKKLASSTTAKAPATKPTAALTKTSTTSTTAKSSAPARPLATTRTTSAAKPAATTTTRTSTTTSKTTSLTTKTTVPTKPLTATKTGSNTTNTARSNLTATKTNTTTTKTATKPTTIKKPTTTSTTTADKNLKNAASNKLSSVKQQTTTIKKQQEIKTEQLDTKIIDLLTQEPTVTTTNGHLDNGIATTEESSPDEKTTPQIVATTN